MFLHISLDVRFRVTVKKTNPQPYLADRRDNSLLSELLLVIRNTRLISLWQHRLDFRVRASFGSVELRWEMVRLLILRLFSR